MGGTYTTYGKIFFTVVLCIGLLSPLPGAIDDIDGIEEYADGDTVRISINDAVVVATVAAREETRRRGLQHHSQLCKQCGMLFVFPSSARHAFWMNKTSIPLDIVWINARWEIVDIRSGVPFDSTILRPRLPARYVLELPHGAIRSYGATLGTRISVVPANRP